MNSTPSDCFETEPPVGGMILYESAFDENHGL